MKAKIKKRLVAVLWVWLSIGLLGLIAQSICACLIFSGISGISDKFQFPLGQAVSIEVDKDSNIYCYTGNLYRLQVFDRFGNFIRGWFADTSYPRGALYIDRQGYIHIIGTEEEHYIFDIHGNMLGELDKSRDDLPIRKRILVDGTEYKIDSGIMTTRIVAEDISSGQKRTVVIDPIYYSPFGGGSSMLLFFMLPFSLLCLNRYIEEKKASGQTAIDSDADEDKKQEDE